jgi:hypothetical protein
VYIIKSLTEVLFNNNRGNSVTKQISLVVLSRPVRALSGAAFKKFEARNCPNLHQISLICVQKRLIVFQLIRHFSGKARPI